MEYVKMAVSLSNENDANEYIPIVLSGHSKDFFSENSLSQFLKQCQDLKELEFSTYYDAIMNLHSIER
jgi:hypothetical protein